MTDLPDDLADPWVLVPSAEITVTVMTAPVPEIPPATLRQSLVQHVSTDGRLDDWSIDADALAESRVMTSYWAWRRTWSQTWPMGPQANIAALWHLAADIGHDVGEPLEQLLRRMTIVDIHDEVRAAVDATTMHVLLTRLETLRARLAGSGVLGVGVIDDTPTATPHIGMGRTWAPPVTDQTLVADRSTALVLRPGSGLVLMHGGPHYQPLPNVIGVDLRTDPVVVTTADGTTHDLPPREARPLSWLIPNALAWHLRDVPIVTVWSALFAWLPEAVGVAQRSGSPMVFSASSPVG